MDFGRIIKDSYKIVWNNRFLWILGILAGGGGTVFSNFSGYSGSNEDFKKIIPDNSSEVVASLSKAGKVLGAQSDVHLGAGVIMAFFLVLAVILLLIYASTVSKGAIVVAVDQIEENEKVTFSESWQWGKKYFWRRLFMGLLISAAILIVLLVLSIPIILLVLIGWWIMAVVIGVIFLVAFIVAMIYFGLFFPYAERILFLEDRPVIESLKEGVIFFNKNWANALLFYLISMGIGLGAGIAIFIAFGITGLVAFGLSALVYLANHIAAYILGGMLGLAILLALIYILGGLNSYNWTFITLAYKEMKK